MAPRHYNAVRYAALRQIKVIILIISDFRQGSEETVKILISLYKTRGYGILEDLPKPAPLPFLP